MEKKYLKVNSILFTILLFLLSWAIAVIYTLPSEEGLIFADFIFAISLLYFLFFIYSHQVVVKKNYKLIINYNKNSEYFGKIFDYNMYYCNFIIGFSAVICDLLLLIIYTTMVALGITTNLNLALEIIFGICIIACVLPVIYKLIQMNIYIVKTNKVYCNK